MELKNKIFKKISRLLSNKVVKYFIIPLLLIFLWVFLSVTYSSYKSFTVLQYVQEKNNVNKFSEEKLLANHKVSGIFTARQNNLGIVSIGIKNVPKTDYVNEDILIFRIRNVREKNWLYENQYRVGQFISDDYFPFGFNEIKDSKNKKYYFELISLKGNKNNSINIKAEGTLYISKYKYTKAEIFKNSSSIIDFAIQKIITFVGNKEVLISSLVFLLPLISYLIWILLPFDENIKFKGGFTGKNLFAISVLILIFIDISFFKFTISGLTLGLLGFWILAIYVNKFNSSINFILALIFIVLAIFSMFFNLQISVDKSSTFAYLLILVGFVQNFKEIKHIIRN